MHHHQRLSESALSPQQEIVTDKPIIIRFGLDKDKDQELTSSVKNSDALLPGEVTRELITEDEIGQTYVSARFLTIQYGTYDREPAVVMHISFAFHSDNIKQYRFRRATIDIQFVPGTPPDIPSIVRCFPEIMYGVINPETRTWGLQMGTSVGVSGIATAALKAKIMRQQEYVRNHRMTIQGTIRGVRRNRVRWSIEEDETQAHGIPPQLSFVLLIRTSGQGRKTFGAKFDVRASIGLSMNPARYMKGNRDDPVYFDSDNPLGPAISASGNDFMAEDFEKFVTLDGGAVESIQNPA